MNGRLTRSTKDAMLGGVCAGLGRYLNVDVTLVRLVFVVLLFAGAGVLVYLLLWIILPKDDETAANTDFGYRAGQMGTELGEAVRSPHPGVARWIGIGLIVAGLWYLLDSLNIPWLRWMDTDLFLPLILIIAGGFLLWRTFRGRI